MNKIILLSGASASGKTSLGKILEKERGFKKLVSYTSRPKREEELDGVDYYFIDEDFGKHSALISLANTKYNGYHYGLWNDEIELAKKDDRNYYFVCDQKGALEIKKEFPDDAVIVWIKVSIKNMYIRMRKRGDSIPDTLKRIYHAIKNKELQPPSKCDLILDGNKQININDIILKTKGE